MCVYGWHSACQSVSNMSSLRGFGWWRGRGGEGRPVADVVVAAAVAAFLHCMYACIACICAMRLMTVRYRYSSSNLGLLLRIDALRGELACWRGREGRLGWAWDGVAAILLWVGCIAAGVTFGEVGMGINGGRGTGLMGNVGASRGRKGVG